MKRLGVDPDNEAHFLVGSTLEGGDSPERLALMCFDGQVVWARDTSSIFSAARSPAFLNDGSGDVVFAGTLAASGSGTARAMQFDGATGADGVESPTDPGGGPDDARVVPGTDRVWFHEGGGSGSDELFLWEVGTNTFLANPTTIGDPAVGSMAALSDSGVLVVDNVSDDLVRFDATGAETWREPLQTADGSSTFRIESQANGAYTTFVDESEGHVYLAVTTLFGSDIDGTYVLRLDVATGAGGVVVSGEINTLSGVSSGTVKTLRRDASGGWWILESTSSAWDILRFDSDWSFVHSIKTAFPDNPMFADHDLDSVVRDLAVLDGDKLILMSGEDNRLSGYSIE
jgi:hypothetical protein